MTCPIPLAALAVVLAVIACASSSIRAQVADTGVVIDDFSALEIAPSRVPQFDGDESPMPLVVSEDVAPEARAAYAKGLELQSRGESARALGEFNRAVAIAPSFALGNVERARALKSLGQDRSAIKSYGNALTATEDGALRATIYFERGRAYLDAGQYQKALDDLDRAAEIQPASADIAHQRGKALAQLAAEEVAIGTPTAAETLTQAVAAFDRTIAARPAFADALADRAGAKANLGQTDEAIEDLTKAAGLQPDDPSLAYRLALLHLQRATSSPAQGESSDVERMTDLESAVARLDAASQLPASKSADDPIDLNQVRLARAVARVEFAKLLDANMRRTHYESAAADCAAVIDDSPRLGAAHYQHGIALRLLGDYREAVAAFTESLRWSPENAEARIRRGIAWYYLDEYDLALNDFRTVGLTPGDPRPTFWAGIIHAQRGDHLEAIREYSEAIDQNPQYRLAYANRALSLMQLGQYGRAIDDLNELIQLDPGDAQAYFRRGLAQQHLGRRDEAQRSFHQAELLRDR
jgi:tetratricopeptide (TPR) repeat protein